MSSTTRTMHLSGYDGMTTETIRVLCRLLVDNADHPRIRARVLQVLAGVQSMDYAEEIRRVWRFILDNVRYMRDPPDREYVTGPVELDEQVSAGVAAEDCESIALYAGTLLTAAGHEVQFEIQGRDPKRPKRFTHCSLVVRRPSGWLSFDVVGAMHHGEKNFTIGDTLHREGQPLERFSPDGTKGADMRYGHLGDGTDAAISVLNSVGGVAPVFGPYGALVGGLSTLAGGIVSLATGRTSNVVVLPQPKPTAPPPGAPPPRVLAPAGPRFQMALPSSAIRAAAGMIPGVVTVAPPPPAAPISTGGKVAMGALALLALKAFV